MQDQVDFLHLDNQDKQETFLQVNAILLKGVARQAQSIQNNKFALLFQCLKKEERDKIVFCRQIRSNLSYKLILSKSLGMVHKEQAFLQVDTIKIAWHGP